MIVIDQIQSKNLTYTFLKCNFQTKRGEKVDGEEEIRKSCPSNTHKEKEKERSKDKKKNMKM